MFRWNVSAEEKSDRADGPRCVVRFAAPQGPNAVRLHVDLEIASSGQTAPALVAHASGISCRLEPPTIRGATLRYVVVVDPPPDPRQDDEVVIDLRPPEAAADPQCRLILRRSTCAIGTSLLGSPGGEFALAPQTQAALLWYACRHCKELVALKQLRAGLSGSDVFVFRTRLMPPRLGEASQPAANNVLDGAWGSCLLVKTGTIENARREWDCTQTYLLDRLHPFLARCEAFLPIRAVTDEGPATQATLVSSFLGGDLMRTQTLNEMARGNADRADIKHVLDRAFAVLSSWHHAGKERPLADWDWIYPTGAKEGLLFKKFDLALPREQNQRKGREEYFAGVHWDMAFISKDHLQDHLVGGKNHEGLLNRLGKIRARFSLTHGDFNTRNVLSDGDNAWLIDFEHTGVGPSLVDFAWLEANFRLWCLSLQPAGDNVGEAAADLEQHLLDHFLGSEGGLEPARRLAGKLGGDPDEVVKLAECITHIRKQALPLCCAEFSDHRDYLAVLYLTVLGLIPHAGKGAAPPENYRVLISLAWVLEDVLSRIVGMKPFDRKRGAVEPVFLLARAWLRAAGAPGRVKYFLDREDGRQALAPLAATRGVLQSQHHHLDVLDHTLLVLAYVEAILDDPLAGMLDPPRLDRLVTTALAEQGVTIAPIPASAARPAPPRASEAEPYHDAIRALLQTALDDDSRLLFKWTALFHDVGKPGTRTSHRTSKGWKVQFPGHEVYGVDLLKSHVRHLFPPEVPIERLIRKHHLHHQICERYADDHRREILKDLLLDSTRSVPQLVYTPGRVLEEVNYLEKHLQPTDPRGPWEFALLMLHGIADSFATRGPDKEDALTRTLEIDLLVLAVATRFAHLSVFQQRESTFHEHANGLVADLAVDGRRFGEIRPLLRTWFLEECAGGLTNGIAGPTRDQVLDKARQLLA